jgi:hypothetical protein
MAHWMYMMLLLSLLGLSLPALAATEKRTKASLSRNT